MLTERFVRMRGFHGLQVMIMLVLFLGANVCYGVSYFENIEKSHALLEEVSSADQIKLEEVFSAKRVGGGWAQGFTVTDRYFVIVTTISDGDNVLTAYDKKTFKVVKSVKCDIGHGNDLAYNENTDEIVALGGPNNTIKFFDAATLEGMPGRELELGTDIMPAKRTNAITYNADLDEYYMVAAKSSIKVWGGDFLPTSISYGIESPFNLYQTISYHNGNIYYARGCHVSSGICRQESTEDEDTAGGGERYAPSTGALIVYNANTGRKDSVYYIPPTNENDRYYGEFEGASIDEKNDIYFLYSSYDDDLPSVGGSGTFVVLRLARDKITGNAKLRKALNRGNYKHVVDSGIEPLRRK